MSSRPQFAPYKVISNGDMSAMLVSQVTIIQKLSLISYACHWVGSAPSGIVTIEVSNDYQQGADGSVMIPGTWNTLPLSAPTGVSGNSDSGFIDVYATAGYAMRLRYTPSSGTGRMDVVVSGKVA